MKIKKIFTTFLSIILSISMIGNVYANTSNISKDEVIYISTEVNGNIRGIYVVNSFELDNDSKVEDYGEYNKVKNLTNLEDISYNNSKIEVKAKKGKFFYQGDNPNKELPWVIKLEYFHNDKLKSPNDILGAKGKVTIKGKISINPKADPVFSKYYLGQLSINIDSKNAIVKTAKDATIAYQGSIQKLNYTILPEKELKFEIETSSKSFSMEPFNFAAIPFNMNFDLPDTSVFINQLKLLENAISQVNGGTSQLTEGLFTLSKSTNLLYNSGNKIYEGLSKLTDGHGELTDGTKKFHNGLNQYSDGINTLVSKIDEMGGGLSQLKDGLTRMHDGSEALTSGLTQYSKGITEYTNGVSKLSKGHKTFTDGIQAIVDKIAPLKEAGPKLVDGSQQIYEGLSDLDKLEFIKNINKKDIQKLSSLTDNILYLWDAMEKILEDVDTENLNDKLVEAKKEIISSIDRLIELTELKDKDAIIKKLGIQDVENEDVKKLIDEFVKTNTQLSKVIDNLKLVRELLGKITENQQLIHSLMESLKGNKEKMKPILEDLRNSLENFDADKIYEKLQQIATFRTEYKKFHDGIVNYIDGTDKLIDGISYKLLPGSKKIDKGLEKLDDGGKQLSSNIFKIKDGISKITDGLYKIISKLNLGDFSQIDKLKKGMDLLVNKHLLILNGEYKLQDGLNKVTTGFGEYITGFGKYESGINQIANGANKLSDGTSTLENETSGMSEKAKKQMDDMMSAFKKKGFKLKSFVDKRNKNINLVQFIYISDALVLKKIIKEVSKKPTLSMWDKIWDIITFWD